jgi:phosphoenolpyruvate carboxykinase (ATP)
MPLAPLRYAKMLQERIGKHNSHVWLINTGWIGGSYGIGQRIDLPYTRSMISAALNNQINLEKVKKDAIFGLRVPAEIVGVPNKILGQKQLWKDQLAYQNTSEKLKKQFESYLTQYNL